MKIGDYKLSVFLSKVFNGTIFALHDENGQIIIRGLQPSTITIRETKAPEGYSLNDAPVTVEIKANDAQMIEIFNDAKQTLAIQKFVTGTTDPIQGVKFLVTDSTGAALGPNNGEYTTDKNGRIILTGLEPGVTVTAKETATANGFVLDTTPQSILIKQGESQTLTMRVSAYELASFNEAANQWETAAGTYRIGFGASVADIRATAQFRQAKVRTFAVSPAWVD